MVSRARNRNNSAYLVGCSVLSNLTWFLLIREMVTQDMSLELLFPYVAGNAIGAVVGSKISERIENMIGAKT